LNKFQHTKLKDKIDDAWREYSNEFPKGQKPKKTLFEIRNKLAQKLYEAETPAVKQEVEEHRKEMACSNEDSDLDKRNKSFQEYVLL
jgi:hypothetical protein